MNLPIFQVDAFASEPFKGNPAAVCILSGPRDDAWMQNLAREMNLSETAFLLQDGPGFNLRWFTPTTEVDLCGHATLAAAHVLWEEGILDQEKPALFNTRSGRLTAHRQGSWIELDFPAQPPSPHSCPGELLAALGEEASFVGYNGTDYLLEVQSPETVRGLTPDFSIMRAVPMRGVMVTARSDSVEYDFISRFFAPGAGIDEDPVTGSAHCCLGPYWADKLGKQDLIGYQASSRGGVIKVQVQGERVLLSGQAVIIFRGELL